MRKIDQSDADIAVFNTGRVAFIQYEHRTRVKEEIALVAKPRLQLPQLGEGAKTPAVDICSVQAGLVVSETNQCIANL